MSRPPADSIDYAALVPSEWTHFPRIASLDDLAALDPSLRFRIYRYWHRQYVNHRQAIGDLRAQTTTPEIAVQLNEQILQRDYCKTVCHLLFCLDLEK